MEGCHGHGERDRRHGRRSVRVHWDRFGIAAVEPSVTVSGWCCSCVWAPCPAGCGRGVVPVSRMERHRSHGDLLAAGAVRSPPEPGVAGFDRSRPLFTRPDPGPHLSVGRGGRSAVGPLPGPVQWRTPVEEGSPAAPIGGDAPGQRPRLSHSGDRRQQRLRLLQRIRPDFLRRGRSGALALAPGAFHQPHGSGRLPHSGRRQGPVDLRPGKRILFCGGGSNDGAGPVAGGTPRLYPWVFHSGALPSQGGRTAGAGLGFPSVDGLLGGERRGDLVVARLDLADEIDPRRSTGTCST